VEQSYLAIQFVLSFSDLLTEQGVGLHGESWLVICSRKVERESLNDKLQSVIIGWEYVVFAIHVVVTLRRSAIVVPLFATILFPWIALADQSNSRTRILTHNVTEASLTTLNKRKHSVAYIPPSTKYLPERS